MTREAAEIDFAVSVIKILTVDQVTALQTKLGIDEVVRLIQSLAGPGGPNGRDGTTAN